MTKHIKHFTIFILLIIIGSIALACTPNNANNDNGLQNATFYDRVEKYAYETYLQDNATRVPFTENDLRPIDRVNVIRTQAELDKAIPAGHIEVDFEKENVILYLFTDINAGYGCSLESIKIQDNQLNIVIFHNLIEYGGNGFPPPSASFPTQRCVAIKTALIDFESTSVTFTYPY